MSSLVSSTVLAQVEEAVDHKIWVKFKEAIPECQVSSGTVTTGKTSLDQLNKDCRVVGIRRVFPSSHKFEKAHQHYGLHQWYEVAFADTLTTPVQTLAELFCKNTWVATAETIPVRTHFSTNQTDTLASANDPRYEDQWHYDNTGQSGGTTEADIRLAAGRFLNSGDQRVVVAVIDGGIDTKHEDLQQALWVNQAEKDGEFGVDDDGNGYVDDVYGYDFSADAGRVYSDKHGTHVAGTIGAVTNNGIGVAGIAGGDGEKPGVKLMSCAVFGRSGQGGFPAAFVYAADNGAVIAQNSWGGGGESQALEDAIRYFNERAGYDNSDEKFDNNIQIGPMAGGLVVFAAGNNKTSRAKAAYPASLESVMAVASLDHNDVKSDFSNYGEWVNIAAPGSEILSTFPGNSYGYLSGTSMACPHVSGVAALVISRFQRQGFSAQYLRRILLDQADNVDELNPSYEGELGVGRVNAYRALSVDTEKPPAVITDLSVTKTTFYSVSLSSTATGSDSLKGNAAYYEVYLSENEIDREKISKASRVLAKLPVSAGATDSVVVNSLKYATSYYFSLRAVDLLGNASPWSNVVRATTTEPPRIQIRPKVMAATVESGQLSVDTITIDNQLGKSPLTFQLSLDSVTASEEWFQLTLDSGTVAVGATQEVLLSWNTRNRYASNLKGTLRVASNDPDNLVTEVPINLTITGQPELHLVSEQLVFGEVYRTFSRTQKLAIHNRGTDTLTIKSVVSDNRFFTVETKSIAIAPQEKYRFEVTFSPESLGEQFGEVIIASDDPQQSETTIPLQGIGLEPPLLLISQPEVVSEVVQDSTLTRQVRLQNTSFTQSLNWALSGELPDWLVPLDSSGSLSPRASGNFQFEMRAESQEVGQYEAQVEFLYADGSLAILPVTMVVIEPNLPPVWSDSLINLSVAINNAGAQVDLRSLITDPENDSLQFSFRWTGETRATVRVLGDDLSIVPQREGTSQGIISAKDQADNQVAVPLVLTILPENQSPEPIQDTLAIAIRLLDEPIEINLDSLFTDPDQDSLTYSFSRPSFSSIDLEILESSVANLRIQDHLLIGKANALGKKETLVYAYDPAGDYSSLTLIISVLEPNQPPLLVQELENQVLVEDQRQIISLLPLFDDPEEDTLQFEVEIEDPTVASIELGADSLQIIALAPGETKVRILAQDEADNQVSVSFSLKVDQVTAVSALLLEEKIGIYPNPTTNWVTVEHPQLQAVRIYGAQGKLYREVTYQLADKVQFSVADLPNGIYSLVVLTQSGKTYRQRLIKK